MNEREHDGFERSVLSALSTALAQEYGRAVEPAVVALFGSRALGRARAGSDVNLAVALDAPMEAAIRQRLEAAIAATLRRDVDLVDLLSAPSHLVSQALRHGRILAGARTPALGEIIARMVAEREDIALYHRRILEERAR
jgi:predicted nucleotidyltransferase